MIDDDFYKPKIKPTVADFWRCLKYLILLFVIGFLILILLAAFALGAFTPNIAKGEFKAVFAEKLHNLDANLICNKGANGKGIDNTIPWYHAYYEVDDYGDIEENIKETASSHKYILESDAEFIKLLKGESSHTPYGDEKFNQTSSYLYASRGRFSISVQIVRDGSVSLYCSDDTYSYGFEKSVEQNKDILVFKVSAGQY